jgi:hypothetical protein
MKTKTVLALLGLGAGCASPHVVVPPPSHPASPAAAEAPRPEPSRTLAGGPVVHAEADDGHDMHREMHEGMKHGAEEDMEHGADEAMEHGMHGDHR